MLSVLLFAQIAIRCSSPSKNPCSTEHQTHAALQTHVSMCAASSKLALTPFARYWRAIKAAANELTPKVITQTPKGIKVMYKIGEN